jgi:hypothetical protein
MCRSAAPNIHHKSRRRSDAKLSSCHTVLNAIAFGYEDHIYFFSNLLVTSPSVRNLIGFHMVKIRTVLASELERYAVSGIDTIRYVSGDKLIKSSCGYCS